MVSSKEAVQICGSLEALSARYTRIRSTTPELCRHLQTEDFVVQSMSDVSPTKWHLAHVTWFFERFVLLPHASNYHPFNDQYHYLFNSYYYTAGKMHERPKRGLLTRPTVREILKYREHVDDAVQEVFLACFKENGVLDAADSAREFRPFLYGVVRNVARHAETRRSRNKEHAPPSGFEPASDEELSAAFDRAWALAVVQAALQSMDDPRQVELLRLRFHDDLPVREIARRWGEEPEKVHRAYAKARDAYEKALVEVVLFHQPGNRAKALEEARRLLALLA